jgi:hypothetical protein
MSEFTGESSANHLRTVKGIFRALSTYQNEETCRDFFQCSPRIFFDNLARGVCQDPIDLATIWFPERIDDLLGLSLEEKNNLKNVYKVFGAFLFFGTWGYSTTMSYMSSLKTELVV